MGRKVEVQERRVAYTNNYTKLRKMDIIDGGTASYGMCYS